MPLTILVFAPLLGAAAVLLQSDERTIWNSALIFSLIPLALSFYLFAGFESSQAGYQFVEQYQWIPQFGISYHLGMDGISLLLVLLTTILITVSLLYSGGGDIEMRPRVLLPDAVPGEWTARHLPRARPVSLLRVLGGNAGADVPSHWHLGAWPQNLCDLQVRVIHDVGVVVDAGGDYLSGPCRAQLSRVLNLRLGGALQGHPFTGGSALAVRRIRDRLRRQSAALAG